jgi:Ca2+-binding RTX toxin-like protein
MKRILLISLGLLALLAPLPALAGQPTYTVLLAGGDGVNDIRIWLTPDGRLYVIDSVVELEVGGHVCSHPEEKSNELICEAPLIAGFEVNGGGGEDRDTVAKEITVPVTMRGGPGADFLLGGSGSDKLTGGSGDDRLFGGASTDLIYGGPGSDVLIGGLGDDLLRGGPGEDRLIGGPGADSARQYRRDDGQPLP